MKTSMLFFWLSIPLWSSGQGGSVNLLHFTAIQSGSSIQVEFATQSETNAANFIIERKRSGHSYSLIGEFSGSGNSIFANYYSFHDSDIFEHCFVYRLKVVFFDSTSQILDSTGVCFSVHAGCQISTYLFAGEDRDGTVTGATLTDDRFGQPNQAYSFDGVDDFVSGGSLNFPPGEDFAIMFWLKVPFHQTNTDTTENVIITRWNENATNSYGYSFHISVNNQTSASPGVLNVSRWGEGCNRKSSLASTSQINDNEFHHILFQKNGNDLELIVDNHMEAVTQDLIICNDLNIQPTFFGKKGGPNPSFFTGILDDIRFFNCALDTADVNYFTPVAELRERDLNIYPNPVLDILYSVGDVSKVEYITVYNLMGQKLKVFESGQLIDLSALQSAMYLVQFRDAENRIIAVKKVIKR